MGRNSLNRTYEEILEINRIRANEYYTNHKEEIKEKYREKYEKLKHDSLVKNKP